MNVYMNFYWNGHTSSGSESESSAVVFSCAALKLSNRRRVRAELVYAGSSSNLLFLSFPPKTSYLASAPDCRLYLRSRSNFALASSSVRGNFSIVSLAAGTMEEQVRLARLPGIQEQMSDVTGFGVGRPSPQWWYCIHSSDALW